MHAVIQRLLEHGVVVTDGAWGTELQARGLAVGACPDGWNLTHSESVLEVARAYVAAGCQIILTNTFGANRIRLAENSLAGRVDEINQCGVAISREAADGRAAVFASIGPCGKLLLNDEVTVEQLHAAFEEQALALKRAGAAALVIETMSDLQEARIAVGAARKTELPIVACMVFDSGRNKDRTMTGVTPEQAAEELAAAGADIIGANCGQGIAGFAAICKRLRAATDRPIWIKANAGLPKLVHGRVVYDTTPEEFASYVPELVNLGASLIGGCCGTNPDFIRAIVQTVRNQPAA